jgi:hypothetical protein
LIGVFLAILSAQCLAADFFPTQVRRDAFLKALAQQDQNYDASAQMLRTPYSSPGYHTTLTGGFVHSTRSSLNYAVALLDSGDPDRLERAEKILDRVISLQDQDPNSPTYGIWSWFLEEPLAKMSPPDWNWADFCGTQLLQVALDHMDRLPADLQQKVQDSILHAARSIVRRNVGPSYTNIALMGTYVTLVAGERFGAPDLSDYGKQRLRRFHAYTQEKGSFTEYNSPTYTLVAIEEISRMRQHVRDPQSQTVLTDLNAFAWRHLARRFHPPTKQWAGPHSRCYSTLLRPTVLAAIQRATAGRVQFLSEAEAWESLDAHRVKLDCPSELFNYFTTLIGPRVEVETFERAAASEHDIVGTTYLHPSFTLASVNIGDLWNQRRPLLGYWKGSPSRNSAMGDPNAPGGPTALRLRCLHDDYDYSSASFFAIQDRNDILGAVLFATDRGDTHISLDKIQNATITAKDLRLRLQFEGSVSDLTIPARPRLDEPMVFASGPIEGAWCIHSAQFTGLHPTLETGRRQNEAWIDLVLYHGPARSFDFSRIAEAAIVFSLSLTSSTGAPARSVSSAHMSVATEMIAAGIESPRQLWFLQRSNHETLSLTIPTKPLPTKSQKAAAAAKSGVIDPWKPTY